MMMMMTPTSGFAMVIGNSPYRVLTLLGRLRSFALSFVFALSLLGLGLCGSTGDELSHFFFRCHFQSKVFFTFSEHLCAWWVIGHQVTKREKQFCGFSSWIVPNRTPERVPPFNETQTHNISDQTDEKQFSRLSTSICYQILKRKIHFLRGIEIEISRVAISD